MQIGSFLDTNTVLSSSVNPKCQLIHTDFRFGGVIYSFCQISPAITPSQMTLRQQKPLTAGSDSLPLTGPKHHRYHKEMHVEQVYSVFAPVGLIGFFG